MAPPFRSLAGPSAGAAISTDPLEEPLRTSAVFLPFPPSLLSRLSPPAAPPRPFFPGISPAPSESDVSERRYSDVSSGSLASSASASASASSESRRLRDWEVRPPPCPPPPPLVTRDRAVAVKKRVDVADAVRAAPLLRKNDVVEEDAHACRSTPFIPVPKVAQPFSNPPRASVAAVGVGVRPMEDDRGRTRLRKMWRLLGGRGRKKDKDKEGRNPNVEGREWKGESMRRLRLRGERSARQSTAPTPEPVVRAPAAPVRRSVPPSASRDAAAARGHGRRPRSVAFAETGYVGEVACGGAMASAAVDRVPLGESPSLGSVCYGYSPQRERVSFADVKREANSFAAYRGRLFFTAEGSSVSSSEDRDEDGAAPESGHLYLSRRQLRAMQYK